MTGYMMAEIHKYLRYTDQAEERKEESSGGEKRRKRDR
jgi:hypothetical protein